MQLDPSQQRAVDLMLAARIGAVTGYPGTGKTTTTRAALDGMDAAGESYLLAAPTGKAARRMAEATGRDASTVHRLLEYNPAMGGFQRRADNPIDADVVVIDEASMLDVELGAALLDAVDIERTRLLLVGDADQLPPVGPGQVFADLIDSGEVPVARLTTLHRAAIESWVCGNSRDIIEGRVPDLQERDDFRFVEVADAARIVGALRDLVTAEGEPWHRAQVLSPQHEGAAGCKAINSALQAVLNPASGGRYITVGKGETLRAGDRVMQTRNDYKLEVMNGELGRVLAVDGGLRVRFEDGRTVAYSLEQARALRLAYAMTVHKTQGSEFPWAVVVCHSTHAGMFRSTGRSLLYTAVTRAKRGVILVGDRKGLGLATNKHQPVPRMTALAERIRGAA